MKWNVAGICQHLQVDGNNPYKVYVMVYTFIGILLGIGFICILPKLMEWTDWSSNDWKKKIN